MRISIPPWTRRVLLAALLAASRFDPHSVTAQDLKQDPLPSWNEGAAKSAIVDFIGRVTAEKSASYVAPELRIATLDNDGTLWAEKPVPFQVAFAIDRVKALAPQHPDWAETQPYKGVLGGDTEAVVASGEKGLLDIMAATHAGMTSEEFSKIVDDWLRTARHARFDRPYTQLAYPPMLELLAYLRANGFKTFIVSGGGVEFMRTFAERVYGIPPEQVVGSSGVVKFEMGANGKPALIKEPKVECIDDGPG